MIQGLNLNNANNLPLINESHINNIQELKTFLYNNIYNDEICKKILIDITTEVLDPFNICMYDDYYYKTIMIKLKKTVIKKMINDDSCEEYNKMFVENIFVKFFNNEYVRNKILSCNNQLVLSLLNNNTTFMGLLSFIAKPKDNVILVYL